MYLPNPLSQLKEGNQGKARTRRGQKKKQLLKLKRNDSKLDINLCIMNALFGVYSMNFIIKN